MCKLPGDASDVMSVIKTSRERSQTEAISLIERLVLILSAIGTASTLGWLFWLSRYGIDFTDEGFYLVWMSNPYLYTISITQFGFVYNPLYEFFNGNIAAIRQANILITFTLAWILVNVFLATVYHTETIAVGRRLIISAAIATTSLVFLRTWLPTPNYNTLALQSLLVTAIGWLLADKKATLTSLLGLVSIGLGGYLAFMAKVSTAAALGVASLVYLLVAGKLRVRLLLIPVATGASLLAISALAIDGSIVALIDRLRGGIALAELVGGGHTVERTFRVDDFQLNERTRFFLGSGTALFFCSAYLSQLRRTAPANTGLLFSSTFGLATLAIVLGFAPRILDAGQFEGLLLWAIVFAAILLGLTLASLQSLLFIPRAIWAIAIGFLWLPYFYAFGTNNNYWNIGSHAGIFWVMVGLTILFPILSARRATALLLSLGLAAQLVAVALIQSGAEAPYRQSQPLRMHDAALSVGGPTSILILPDRWRQYLAGANELVQAAGFRKGTPMIDLSGQSPGVLYSIGARSVGQAWMIGGYPGSDDVAARMLEKVSCQELADAWLLTEPEGPRRLSSNIVAGYGADIGMDFSLVGTLQTPEGAGGYPETRSQQIFKPRREGAKGRDSCLHARAVRK